MRIRFYFVELALKLPRFSPQKFNVLRISQEISSPRKKPVDFLHVQLKMFSKFAFNYRRNCCDVNSKTICIEIDQLQVRKRMKLAKICFHVLNDWFRWSCGKFISLEFFLWVSPRWIRDGNLNNVRNWKCNNDQNWILQSEILAKFQLS